MVGGLFQLLLLGFGYLESYSFSAFLAAYVTGTLPGMVLQLLLIPPIVLLAGRYFFLYYSHLLSLGQTLSNVPVVYVFCTAAGFPPMFTVRA